jgi:hypothetical protein
MSYASDEKNGHLFLFKFFTFYDQFWGHAVFDDCFALTPYDFERKVLMLGHRDILTADVSSSSFLPQPQSWSQSTAAPAPSPRLTSKKLP